MTLPMFDLTVPALIRGMEALATYLDRIADGRKEHRLGERDLFGARLAPDMFSLGQQIQRASDNAKNGVGRLASIHVPSFDDGEKSLEEFRARVDRTIEFLRAVSIENFVSSETREIDQSFRGLNRTMKGSDYLLEVLLPNFYFHVSMAHGILRHEGVQIGKQDYLGNQHSCNSTLDVQTEVSATSANRILLGHIRFLTKTECHEWLQIAEVPELPVIRMRDGVAQCLQFVPQPLEQDLREVIGLLISDFGEFEGGLLRVTDWMWDEEYDQDPTDIIRMNAGEDRPLNEVPCFAFDKEGAREAINLIALIIERRWTAYFYFASNATTLFLCEGDRIDLWTANDEVEQRARARLAWSGLPISLE